VSLGRDLKPGHPKYDIVTNKLPSDRIFSDALKDDSSSGHELRILSNFPVSQNL
jgi:hypothetical protein